MLSKFIYPILAVAPLALFAFSTGPQVNRTGGIVGSTDCTACHRTFAPANSDPTGSVKLEGIAAYQPGVAQAIKVTISHPAGQRWGFQLTARFVTDGKMAGSFAPADDLTKVICDNGTNSGAPGPCTADVFAWIEHNNAVRTTGVTTYSYNVQWTPPATENGDIIFYYAGNAANGDGSLNGDRIYTAQTRISLSASASCSISKKPTLRSIVNAAPHAGNIAPNAMIEVYGADFQAGSRSRLVGAGDLGSGKFPTELSCIAVEIDGQRAPIYYVQQDQINAQVPTTTKTGPVNVVVIANPGRPNELRSDTGTVTMQALAPAFFTFNGKSIAARVAGQADIIADPAVVSGATPAKPSQLVSLFGSGFGLTSPSAQAGDIVAGLSPITGSYTLTIGGTQIAASDVQYIGLAPQSISGLYQLNVKLPDGLAEGDQPVVLTIGGVSSPAATIPVKK